ncbi:DNA-primase RepB domain-containing protein [Ruegeria lacuscaerulensis]|uniref:DNA-primase RepB domain-containing protein n=1 Tax=Ruegeria lacuscaerulensis TaxID=55218 RepID=UPI00147FFC68|nr:DNA-primase RepB domain-containing protein [Ruegeria lacuscaerulensis]
MSAGKKGRTSIDVAAAIEHLLWLVALQGEGFLCIRIFAGGKVRKTGFFHNRDDDIEQQLRKFLCKHCRKGDHVFYSVNAFSVRSARASYCVPGRVLHVDADQVSLPPPGPMPTRIIESSPRNHHFFYALEEPISPQKAQTLSRTLTALVGGDKGGHSPAKLFRLPGTRNEKY